MPSLAFSLDDPDTVCVEQLSLIFYSLLRKNHVLKLILSGSVKKQKMTRCDAYTYILALGRVGH